MLNLEEIKAREQAATPGEWKVVCQGNAVQSLQVVTETYWERPVQISVCSSISPKREADADFIAAARADIPALIEQHEQDEQQIATLKKALELACNAFPIVRTEHTPDYFIQQAQEGQK